MSSNLSISSGTRLKSIPDLSKRFFPFIQITEYFADFHKAVRTLCTSENVK